MKVDDVRLAAIEEILPPLWEPGDIARMAIEEMASDLRELHARCGDDFRPADVALPREPVENRFEA